MAEKQFWVVFIGLLLACGCTAQTTAAMPGAEADADAALGSIEGGTDGGMDACREGESVCNATCTDLATDNANCGFCGITCPSGTTCAAGSCCPPPTILCGTMCLDPREDDVNCGACGKVCSAGQHCAAGTCQASKIQHVVLIVQENHTFDAYFGRYCQAPSGSNPTCVAGRACCEGAPKVEPKGAEPMVLDDKSNFAADRNHQQWCELTQIHDGAMDGYVVGSADASTCKGFAPVTCASPNNWAVAEENTVGPYWALADGNALGDRYFQPIAGGTSSNNMYFATAHFQFLDNEKIPEAIGTSTGCIQGLCLDGTPITYPGTTIADLLVDAGKTFTVYADGYADAAAVAPACEAVPSDCPYSLLQGIAPWQACKYDSSDIPFVYYARFRDTDQSGNPRLKQDYIRDYKSLQLDVDHGLLPNFAYVKARAFHNEHPNVSKISDGIAFVEEAIQTIERSSYADGTLILLTWDEGGGFFDHVRPPTAPPVDVDVDDGGKPVPYGTRVPLLAIGPFARKGAVSHVEMEHSSIVKFLEYNFLTQVGQLHARDKRVNNIGSLLDPVTTVVRIPER